MESAMDSAIIILFVSVVVIGVALMVIIGLTKKAPKTLDREAYQREWLNIEQSVTDDPNTMQFAILRADKLLDRALRERGFAGQTMADRMKAATKQFSNANSAWAAHKLRNRVAHEDRLSINRKLTSQALNSFKKALRDLGAL